MSSFDVDISGLLRVFGGHLYSSPGVFVRELVQNANDAILEARAAGAVTGTIVVRVDPEMRTVSFEDDGIGLDEEGIKLGLGRLGWSSKRRDNRPKEIIGQFGIGLLSGFLVSETLVVVTQRKGTKGLIWKASRSGAYTIEEAPELTARSPGTTVTLVLDDEHRAYCEPARVRALLEQYVRYLPRDVYFEHGRVREKITVPAPWLATDEDTWRSHLRSRGIRTEIVFPIQTESGRGFGWVSERKDDSGAGRVDVYHHGMLLEEGARDLLPKWAGFLSAVIESSELSPTASRETFVKNDAYDALKSELSGVCLSFLMDLARGRDMRFEVLLRMHHLFLRHACTESDELMAVIGHRMPFETNLGNMDLAAFTELCGERNVLRIVETMQEFAHVAPLATAQGLGVINASYANDSDFLDSFARMTSSSIVRMNRDELSVLVQPAPDLTRLYERVRKAAEPLLDALDVSLEIGRFEPSALPAFLLTDATQLKERARTLLTGSESPLVRALISGLAVTRDRQKTRFILNANNALVQALPGSQDTAATAHMVRLLYLQSAMMFRRTLSIHESRGFTDDLLALLTKLLVPVPRDVN